MSCVVGIDLGSTTTKAVILDGRREVLGRGITNSRSNYDLAAAVAKTEAFINARFGLIERQLEARDGTGAVGRLRRAFVMEQLLHQLRHLEQLMVAEVERSAPAALQAPFRARSRRSAGGSRPRRRRASANRRCSGRTSSATRRGRRSCGSPSSWPTPPA